MKTCLNCGDEFEPNNHKQKFCSQRCYASFWRKNNPEKVKAAQIRNDEKRKGVKRYDSDIRRRWYAIRKEDKSWAEKIRNQGRHRNKRVKEFVRRYKLLVGCVDCGYKGHHAALDMDHIGMDKEINVAFAKSIRQAKEEMRKCEVVCSNCHRIRTYNRIHEKSRNSLPMQT